MKRKNLSRILTVSKCQNYGLLQVIKANERYEQTKSYLETEIVDLRDLYIQMSLRYAELEAQREDLVLKLKASSNGKRSN